MEGVNKQDRLPLGIPVDKPLTRKSTLDQKIVQLIVRVVHFFVEPSFIHFRTSQNALLTQEHLGGEAGSHFSIHNVTLQNILDEGAYQGEGSGFQTLRKELKEADAGHSFTMIPTPDHEKRFAESMRASIDKLQPGEGAILDMTSIATWHGMMMRVVREDDNTATVYWANTGAGTENKKFHPSKQVEGKELCQRVAVMKNVPFDKLTAPPFLEDLSDAVFGYKRQESSVKSGPFGESANIIGDVYVVLDQFCTENNVTLNESTDKDEKYWGRQQIAASCVPSSMWAIMQTILSDDEYKYLKTDARIRTLQRNYSKIIDGSDRSDTAKIMASNEVQKLMHVYEKNKQKLPEQVQNIQCDLRIPVDADVTIKTGTKLTAEDMKHPMTVTFSKKRTLLEAEAKFERDDSTVEYQITVGDDGKASGARLVDRIYLLYLDIAKGEKEGANERFQQILEEIKDNQIELDKEEWEKTVGLLDDLINKLHAVDKTRAGLAKQYALLHLECFVWNNAFGENFSVTENHPIPLTYRQLNVSAYLSEDNVWLKGIQQLSPKKT